MKMHLMTFDEACETFNRKYPTKGYPTEVNCFDRYVFGLNEDSIPWGENVEVDIGTLDASDNVSVYKLNGCFVPTCMFKVNDKEHDKEPSINDILRYGTILTDDNLICIYKYESVLVRIRIIAYNENVYYHKMLDSEVVEFKKVGVAR